MKIRNTFSIALALSFVLLLIYISVGFVLWRSGFLPRNQSFMERVVTIAFLLMMCLSPLGILSWRSISRAARKQAAAHNKQKALELQTRAHKHLTSSLVECALGGAGYYLVSRRVFPQIDVMWIFSALILPPAVIHIWFRLRWNSLRQQQMRNQIPTRYSSVPQ
jgi:hypothetical protein